MMCKYSKHVMELDGELWAQIENHCNELSFLWHMTHEYIDQEDTKICNKVVTQYYYKIMADESVLDDVKAGLAEAFAFNTSGWDI